MDTNVPTTKTDDGTGQDGIGCRRQPQRQEIVPQSAVTTQRCLHFRAAYSLFISFGYPDNDYWLRNVF